MKTKLNQYLLALVAWFGMTVFAGAAVRTWDGGGPDNNWTTAANWDAAVAEGDDLVFPGGAGVDPSSLNNTNDFPSLTTFGSITFSGTNYVLRGPALFLTNGIIAQSSGTNTVTLSVVVNAPQRFTNEVASGVLIIGGFTGPLYLNLKDLTIGTLGQIDVVGQIIGTGDLTKTGIGTLRLLGNSANTLSGSIFVNEGVLELNKSAAVDAVPGALIIGDGVGAANSATVRLLANNQINDSAPVTLAAEGLLDLNDRDDTLGPLTFNGGDITTGTGTLFMGGDVTVNASAASQAVVAGKLNLGSTTRTFTGTDHNWSPDIRITASISGSGDLTLNASNYWELILSASNSYSGLTIVNGGSLGVDNSTSLGSPASGTVVNAGANLTLYAGVHIGNEPLTLNGSGSFGGGAFLSYYGSNSWAGDITLGSDSYVAVRNTDWLNLTGVISGGGGLVKKLGGTLQFSGTSPNTYAGTTTVNDGTLLLGKSAGVTAVPGALVIGDGVGGPNTDVVRLQADSQIDDDSTISINNSGLLDVNGFTEVVGAVSGTGNLQIGAGAFSVGFIEENVAFDGIISGSGALIRNGLGAWILGGTNTFSGSFVVNGPSFVNGTLPASLVSVHGTLGGTGTVGPVSVGNGGILSPGLSAGALTTSNVTLVAGSTFRVELNGSTPGVGYDQLKVRGAVNDLGGAILNATLGFPSAISNSFTIIDNDTTDAVTNTFLNLPEGAPLNVSGTPFQISYAGGDGNDVVLLQLAATQQPVLSIQRSQPTEVVVSWPTNFTGYVLEANTNLNSNVWAVVVPAPGVSGTNNVVTNLTSGQERYFRLRAP